MTTWTVTGDAPEMLSQEEARRIARAYYLPGEKVRLEKGLRFSGEDPHKSLERANLFGDRTLTVAWLEIEMIAGSGNYRPLYRFEGLDGTWPAAAFKDDRPTRHAYGVVTELEDDLWFTAMDEDKEGQPIVAADPLLLTEDLSAIGQRFFADAYHVDDAAGVVRMLRSELCGDDGCAGEFTLRQNGEGQWHVDGISWTTAVSEAEKSAVDDRIRSMKAVTSNPSMG